MQLYGLIGKTLKHSFSEAYFREKFDKEKIDGRFLNFELKTIAAFPNILSENTNLCGLSVTIPYKTAIIPFLDELDPIAKEIGSVNSIRVSNGKTIGFNTDASGFSNSIKPFLAHGMERALVLGTGGASKAVAYALRRIGLDVVFASRTPEEGQLAYSEINQNAINAFKLIVNTTPLGMYPYVSSFPDIPYEYLTPEHLLFDLTYNPAETEFLRKGNEKGAIVVNGLSMLKIQAEMSWEIWTR